MLGFKDKMNIFRILTGFSIISFSTATFYPSVCTPFKPGANEPVKPNISAFDSYFVRVEANIVNKHYTADYTEWFDYKNNRAAMNMEMAGTRMKFIYSFGTDELLTIDRKTRACNASTLANSSSLLLSLFGRQTGPDQAKIYTAGATLRFYGNISEKWMGKTSIRGIPCNQWRSCLYWDARNTTMVLDWYMSVPGWITTEWLDQVPIRAHVKGIATRHGQNHSFEHFYDFMDFSSTILGSKPFETPEGAYCPNRKLTKQLPLPGNAFHFTAEVLDMKRKLIGWSKEWYDFQLKVVKFDSTPIFTSPYGQNPWTVIHDFNTGVSYVIDQYRGNCTVKNISSVNFDVRMADPTHVRIRTAQEFFDFDKTLYNYEGQKMVRGMLCDVWITQRNDWPSPSLGWVSTWEWYFATSTYSANLGDLPSFGMPVMLELKADIQHSHKIHHVYNMYAYDEQKPVIWDYNIGQCFGSSARRDFSLLLPGNYRDIVNANMDVFKYAIIKTIKTAVNGISPLRINNIQVDYADNHDIIVYFTILERPPPIGDVVNPLQEVDLNTVSTLLTKALKNGSLTVSLNPPGSQNIVTISVKPNSLKSSQTVIQQTHYQQTGPGQTSTISGYSGGLVAGVAIGLLAISFIFGALGVFLFFNRKKNGAIFAVKFEKHEKEDITVDFS